MAWGLQILYEFTSNIETKGGIRQGLGVKGTWFITNENFSGWCLE